MLFNSYMFVLAFLPIVVIGFYVLARRFAANVILAWLIAASFVFYGWHSVGTLILFVALCAADLIFARYLVLENKPKAVRLMVFILALAGCLGPLAYFKYTDFLIANVNALSGSNHAFFNLILPLGISFFTFQRIAFLADCYSRIVSAISAQGYVFFIFFFPQLVAGPIVHHSEIMPQLRTQAFGRFDARVVALGVSVFAVGLFKKTVLADGIAPWADVAFDSAHAGSVLSFTEAWVGALAYSFQLYFDFSGYSDMAIGIGLLFGLRLPVNFWSPYKANSIIEFWRRWHITLSRFLRDYIYIPIGGNRRGTSRRYLNIAVVMVVGGIWHGAAWTFIAWGAMHGGMLMMNHVWVGVRTRMGWSAVSSIGAYVVVCRVVTFLVVVYAWVLFRASDFDTVFVFWRSMSGLGPGGILLPVNALLRDILTHLDGIGTVFGHLAAGASGENGTRFFAAMQFDWNLTNAPGSTLVVIVLFYYLVITHFSPNMYQLAAHLWPALGVTASDAAGPPARSWKISARWAIVTAFLLAASILTFTRISPFLYFQF